MRDERFTKHDERPQETTHSRNDPNTQAASRPSERRYVKSAGLGLCVVAVMIAAALSVVGPAVADDAQTGIDSSVETTSNSFTVSAVETLNNSLVTVEVPTDAGELGDFITRLSRDGETYTRGVGQALRDRATGNTVSVTAAHKIRTEGNTVVVSRQLSTNSTDLNSTLRVRVPDQRPAAVITHEVENLENRSVTLNTPTNFIGTDVGLGHADLVNPGDNYRFSVMGNSPILYNESYRWETFPLSGERAWVTSFDSERAVTYGLDAPGSASDPNLAMTEGQPVSKIRLFGTEVQLDPGETARWRTVAVAHDGGENAPEHGEAILTDIFTGGNESCSGEGDDIGIESQGPLTVPQGEDAEFFAHATNSCDQPRDGVRMELTLDENGDGDFGTVVETETIDLAPAGTKRTNATYNSVDLTPGEYEFRFRAVHDGETYPGYNMSVEVTSEEGSPAPGPEPFSLTVNTSRAGVTNDTSFLIGTGNGVFDYNVSWRPVGGGAPAGNRTGLTGDATIDFGQSGTYYVNITGQFPHLRYPTDSLNDQQYDQPKIETIEQWGDINWESFEFAFAGARNLEYRATDTPDLTDVTSLEAMFSDAESFNGAIGDWDTASVTNMRAMFQHADSFDQPIGGWDTASVTDMSSMFFNADSFNRSIGDWDTSSVTTMRGMFSATDSFDQPLGDWDTSSVTDMGLVFSYAESFNQPLGSWNVSSVSTMSQMFQGTESFDRSLLLWDTSSVTSMYRMFADAESFDQPIGSWETSSVTSMVEMFEGAESFTADISSWCVEQIPTRPDEFDAGAGFEGQDEIQPNWGAVCGNLSYQISNLAPEATTVTEGDPPISISVTITNTGDVSGTGDIFLSVTDERRTESDTLYSDTIPDTVFEPEDPRTVTFESVPVGTLPVGEHTVGVTVTHSGEQMNIATETITIESDDEGSDELDLREIQYGETSTGYIDEEDPFDSGHLGGVPYEPVTFTGQGGDVVSVSATANNTVSTRLFGPTGDELDGSDGQYILPEDGEYTIRVSFLYDPTGDDDNEAYQLTLNRLEGEAPQVAFEVVGDPAVNSEVTLYAEASGEDSVETYEWAFGDGTSATGKEVTHAFTRSGELTVELTIIDEHGDEAVVTRQVEVESELKDTFDTDDDGLERSELKTALETVQSDDYDGGVTIEDLRKALEQLIGDPTVPDDYDGPDIDGDGFPDALEQKGIPVRESAVEEYSEAVGGSPNITERAGDPDWMVRLDTDPVRADTDGDGLSDGEEIGDMKQLSDPPVIYYTLNSDPTDPNSDDTGLADKKEVRVGSDPMTPEYLSVKISTQVTAEAGCDPIGDEVVRNCAKEFSGSGGEGHQLRPTDQSNGGANWLSNVDTSENKAYWLVETFVDVSSSNLPADERPSFIQFTKLKGSAPTVEIVAQGPDKNDLKGGYATNLDTTDDSERKKVLLVIETGDSAGFKNVGRPEVLIDVRADWIVSREADENTERGAFVSMETPLFITNSVAYTSEGEARDMVEEASKKFAQSTIAVAAPTGGQVARLAASGAGRGAQLVVDGYATLSGAGNDIPGQDEVIGSTIVGEGAVPAYLEPDDEEPLTNVVLVLHREN